MSILKTILLFGAGKSATVLIDYLIKESVNGNWKVIVADSDEKLIREKTGNNQAAETAVIDITDDWKRVELIRKADVVISMMPPALHILVARDCIKEKRHLLTASYADDEIRALDHEAKENGLLFLCEMGLDPGIDHMSAMALIEKIRGRNGIVQSFKSHCGGLVAPESDNNPWHYKISWNPRNVVLAGKAGAVYKLNGSEVKEEYHQLFDSTRMVKIAGSTLESLGYYPNRNSLPYIDLYGLGSAHTFIRTTLRYSDFMYGWKNIVDLQLTDETPIYETDGKSLYDFYREHLEKNGFGEWLQKKLTEHFTETKALLENLMKLMEAEEEAELEGAEVPGNFLMVDATGDLKDVEIDEIKSHAASTVASKMHEANLIMKQLFFLGLDDQETLINKGKCSAADVLQFALEKNLKLEPGDKDMVVMQHEIEYTIGETKHCSTASLVVTGEDHIHTAMAKTVGLPLGIAARLLLNGELKCSGVRLPVSKEIYDPVLAELEKNGIRFHETDTVSDL